MNSYFNCAKVAISQIRCIKNTCFYFIFTQKALVLVHACCIDIAELFTVVRVLYVCSRMRIASLTKNFGDRKFSLETSYGMKLIKDWINRFMRHAVLLLEKRGLCL